MRRSAALLLALALPLVLAGCSEPVAATPGFTPAVAVTATPTPSPTEAAADDPTWTTASACAALSVATSTVANAVADRAAKRISKAQRAEVLSTAGASFRLVRNGIGDSGPLAGPVDALVALTPDIPTAAKAGFSPASAAYTAAMQQIADTCTENGTALTAFSPLGG